MGGKVIEKAQRKRHFIRISDLGTWSLLVDLSGDHIPINCKGFFSICSVSLDMMCRSIVGWFSLVMIWWNWSEYQKSINQLYAKAWLALTGLLIIQPPSMSNRDSCLPPWWHHRILAPLSSHSLSSCVGVLDSIAVSLFVDWLSFSNPNNNLVMRRSGLS